MIGSRRTAAPGLGRRGRYGISGILVAALLITGCGETSPGEGTSAAPGDSALEDVVPDANDDTTDDANASARSDAGSDATSIVPLDGPVDPQLPVTAPSINDTDVDVTDVSRIAPLSGALTEIVISLGLGDNIVARDVGAQFPQVDHVPVVTDGHDVSAESVLSTRPTVVVADTFVGPPEALEAISGAGIPVVILDEAWSLDDVAGRIRAVADALGVPDAGDRLVERTEEELDAARQTAADVIDPDDPPRVAFLYLRGTAGVYLLGGDGSGADAMIEAVGAVDAGTAAELGAYTPITSEALIAAAPEVILVMEKGLDSVGGVEGLVELPGIAQTPAGREQRVIVMDDVLLLSFGPRTGAAVQQLSHELAALLDDGSSS